jgi:hypothetical protein
VLAFEGAINVAGALLPDNYFSLITLNHNAQAHSNCEHLRSWCRLALAKRRGFSGRYFWTKDGP